MLDIPIDNRYLDEYLDSIRDMCSFVRVRAKNDPDYYDLPRWNFRLVLA